MRRDQRVYGAAQFTEGTMSAGLILAHQPAETDDIRVKNRGEFPPSRRRFPRSRRRAIEQGAHRGCLTSPQRTSTIFDAVAPGHVKGRPPVALRGAKAMSRTSFFGLKSSAMMLATLLMTLSGYAARGDEPKLSISGYDP